MFVELSRPRNRSNDRAGRFDPILGHVPGRQVEGQVGGLQASGVPLKHMMHSLKDIEGDLPTAARGPKCIPAGVIQKQLVATDLDGKRRQTRGDAEQR